MFSLYKSDKKTDKTPKALPKGFFVDVKYRHKAQRTMRDTPEMRTSKLSRRHSQNTDKTIKFSFYSLKKKTLSDVENKEGNLADFFFKELISCSRGTINRLP